MTYDGDTKPWLCIEDEGRDEHIKKTTKTRGGKPRK